VQEMHEGRETKTNSSTLTLCVRLMPWNWGYQVLTLPKYEQILSQDLWTRGYVLDVAAGSANMMQQDPAGAKFLVRIFDPGQVRPSSRFALVCSSLKISRTYSLSARVNRFAASGVTICNNVFSDLVADQALGSWSVEETVSQEPESWRRGFYDKPRSWELEGPKAGDKTDLTRKFATQKDHQIGAMPNPKRSIEEKLSAKARNLSRMAAKRRRRQATLGRPSGNA
ncbi:unnamed protein product, partial [Cladocopium goreaui]